MDDVHHEVRVPSATRPESFVAREMASSLKSLAFECMNQVDGWCSFQKAAILIDLIKGSQPEVVVEIGVWGGKSLLPMACALKDNGKGVIYGIDPWSSAASLQWVNEAANIYYWGHVDHEGVMNHLISKVHQFGLDDHVKIVRATSSDAKPIGGIDILHIDGNHTEASTLLDVMKWVPQVRSGGWIIFDDMTWFENGVYTAAKAVAWLDAHCVRFAQFSENCDWGIWYKL